MRRSKSIKRGFTLVEVVISVAILVVLLIPIATITVTTIKTSASAEDRQKATIIGQQLLEELKSKDVIPLTSSAVLGGNDTFKLLNGQTLGVTRDAVGKITQIDPDGVGETFTVMNDGVEYQVRLVMTRDASASYEAAVPPTIGTYNQSLYFYNGPKVNVIRDTSTNVMDPSTHTILNSQDLILNIGTDMGIQLIDGKTNLDPLTKFYPMASRAPTDDVSTGGSMLINIDKSYSGNVKLEINSVYTQPITIDIIKEARTSSNITVVKGTTAGDILINNNISIQVPVTIGDLYRVEVSVSRTGTSNLFEDVITKNISF